MLQTIMGETGNCGLLLIWKIVKSNVAESFGILFCHPFLCCPGILRVMLCILRLDRFPLISSSPEDSKMKVSKTGNGFVEFSYADLNPFP